MVAFDILHELSQQLTFGTHIHDPHRMNYNDFDDPSKGISTDITHQSLLAPSILVC